MWKNKGKVEVKKLNIRKPELKKMVLCCSLTAGCAAVIIGAMAAPLSGILVNVNQETNQESNRGNKQESNQGNKEESNHENNQKSNQESKQEEAVMTGADGNWGLSFQQEGSAPVGNATQEYLAKYNAFYIGPSGAGPSGAGPSEIGPSGAGPSEAGPSEAGPSGAGPSEAEPSGAGTSGAGPSAKTEAEKKPVYLTFDAGYENGYTAEILDVLKEEKVPAAFFLVGNYIEENPQLVKRMEAEGHIVGNHTMHHPDMSAIADEEAFKKEIGELEDTYKAAVGKELPKFYRPPQGKYSEKNLEHANKLGYTTVFWSLAYVDWLENDQPTREEALNILNKRIHPGAIVLLHSTSKTNSRILGELIKGWKESGYEFHSISELGTGKL